MYENLISTRNLIRNRIYQEISCMKTCNPSQTGSKRKYYILKRIITTCSIRKRTNIKNLKKKVIARRFFQRKPYFNLQTYSKAYISRNQLYENMQCVTGLFENTNILPRYTKTSKHFQIYSKRYEGRSRVYENKIST